MNCFIAYPTYFFLIIFFNLFFLLKMSGNKIILIYNGSFLREILPFLRKKHIIIDYNRNRNFLIPNLNLKDIILKDIFANNKILITAGESNIRYKISKIIPVPLENIKYHTLISSKSHFIDKKSIKIGDGSIICPGVIMTTNISIGNHCHFNLNSTIGHDSIIGNFVTFSPGVNISGSCKIGNNVFFGTNSSVKNGISICDNVVVGMNSAVIENITESGIYAGVPARRIKDFDFS